jgi:DNA polymerase-3 subunit gamma/tau
MNQFVVSARKYRPATFDSVVGQAHITNTLKNAIKTKHLAQAFLFCGPRGVGKTTCARILAKTLNCKSITSEFEACNVCESCVSFNNAQSLNIYELDAASNNSVDDIRNLVEQVRYAPHAGEYKIYIIDEVHMLSASAFNAFLKTLEEPPSYAIFILATTEKHKIIPTILSRCQIFDFNRIQVEDIATHLEYVAKSEHVTAEADALHIIAQKADGALRDALSIFDQIVSFAGTNVTYKDVINNLSILDYDYYFNITDAIKNGNISSVLLTFSELLADGFDGHHFINGLANHFRDLLVCRDAVTISLLEVSKNIREKYKQQAAQTPTTLLLSLLDLCSKCDIEYRIAKNQRLHVELTLIKMCSLSGVGFSNTVTTEVAAVEKKTPDVTEAPKPAPKPVVAAVVEEKKEVIAPTPAPIVEKVAEPMPKVVAPDAKPAEVAPVAAAPKPAFVSSGLSKSGGSLLKGTSISAAMTNTVKEDDKKAISLDDMPADAFESETLENLWEQYANMQNAQGKRQLHTTLTMNKPEILAGNVIELVIHNESQENLLMEERQGLMDFLRKALNNYHLQFTTRIEAEMASDIAYTNKDKYQRMAQKNPDLEEFRKQLGLDLEL